MPSKFDFISPDILLREVDESQVPPNPVDDGILIIGQASRGPAMKPIKINNIASLDTTFGLPYQGESTGEIYRNGNSANPTYGLFAAQAWLASNTSPVTYVRLAGEEVGSAYTSGKAGWDLGGVTYVTGAAAGNILSYGLWMTPSHSAGVTANGTLAAIIYTKDAALTLSGTLAGTAITGNKSGTFIKSLASDGGFLITVSSSTGTEDLKLDMTPGSSGFIRKTMNLDPQKLISGQKGETKKYFLGETFETEIKDIVLDTSSSSGDVFGILLPLAQENVSGNSYIDHIKSFTAAKTGWFIANDPAPQSATGSFNAANMKKLFRFHSLIEGEAFQKQYSTRITIDSLGSTTDPYTKFSVAIYDMKSRNNVEGPLSCDLNPNSDKYIAKVFGDQVVSYNSTKQKFVTTGEFTNVSNYVRVEMSTSGFPASAIPFGFYGPARPKAFSIGGSGSAHGILHPALIVGTGATYAHKATGSLVFGGHEVSGTWADYRVSATASFTWPSLSLTDNNSAATFQNGNFFGFRQQTNTDSSTSTGHDYQTNAVDYIDLLRALPNSEELDTTGTYTEFSFIFTLDEIVQDSAINTQFYYKAGSHVDGTAYTAINGTTASIETVGINKIVAPFMGGTDGVDIQYVDPFSSYQVMNAGSKATNYAIAAVDKVIDFVSDPEFVQYDLIAMPGIIKSSLVNDLLGNTEERGDALAIVDMDSGFISGVEKAVETAGSVNTVVASIKAQNYNTSYGATYYPEVRIRADNGSLVTMPSSVAGIGAIAQSEADSLAPWFAPAGFNRGGISQLGGLKGPKVSNAAETLNKAERDKLYLENINPIANFPGEGPVVFGQKTLQQTPSALDRINVRRLMIYLKKRVGEVARTVLFDQNVNATWNRFKAGAEPILADAKSRFGVSEYKLILDETTTTPDYQDRNIMYAKVFIKPAKAIEFIAIDFTITRSGIEF